jgi:hypothetical protein
MYYSNNILKSSQLGITAYESTIIGSKIIGIGFNGVSGSNAFNLDSLAVPYTFMPPSEYFWGGITYYSDGSNSCVFCEGDNTTYSGITRGSVIITVESKSNDTIVGKFSGEIQTITGKKLTIKDGKFRGKFNRIRVDI